MAVWPASPYLTPLVLEPDSDHPRTQSSHLHQLLLQPENIRNSNFGKYYSEDWPSSERLAWGWHCSKSWECWVVFHWGQSGPSRSSWLASFPSSLTQWGLPVWSLHRDQTATLRQTGHLSCLKCRVRINISQPVSATNVVSVLIKYFAR